MSGVVKGFVWLRADGIGECVPSSAAGGAKDVWEGHVWEDAEGDERPHLFCDGVSHEGVKAVFVGLSKWVLAGGDLQKAFAECLEHCVEEVEVLNVKKRIVFVLAGKRSWVFFH